MVTAARDTARGYLWLARTLACGLRRRVGRPDRHLLLLAWAFPPRTGGGVYRPAALARYASQRGWRVTVICAGEPEVITSAGRHMLGYVGTAVRILRVAPPSWRPSDRAFPSVDGGFLNALAMADEARKALADDPPGVILASGPPFHSFVAARYIARAMGTPFVLDYRDEWTECPFTFVEQGNADAYYERTCLREATRVIFTTESHLYHQLRAFPMLSRARGVVIPNGWEPVDRPIVVEAGSLPERAGIHIAFVGSSTDYALPEAFLGALATVLEREPSLESNLRLTFVGRRSAGADRVLRAFPYQGLLEVMDEVPRPQAMAIMRQADALLLINDDLLARYRPGKLYDYLAMETPILVYGSGGEVATVVRQFEAGRVVPAGDVEALGKALDALGGLRGQASRRGIREWLSQHTREKLAGQMIDLLEEIVPGSG